MSLEYGTVKDDDALYRQFLQGDTASYDELMIRYGDRLTYYLHGYIHDLHEAEDMMIEAFARIMVKRPSLGDGAFRAYLFKTGRNLVLCSQSLKRRMQTFSIDGLEPEIADSILAAGGAINASPVEEELRQKERKQVLHLCLGRIEPDLREVLWLIYYEGMSYAQAASVMGVNEKRIDRLLYRGKRTMRIELEKEGITGVYG